jgi:hypothetical protein
MNSIRAGVAFGLVLFLNSAAQSEDASATLPDDGWWFRYSVTTKEDREGNTEVSTVKHTYSLIGTATENGEKCRWVEMKIVGYFGGKDRTQIAKLLVPERDLLESEHPLNRLVRGWNKIDDAAARELRVEPPEAGPTGNANRFYEMRMLVFPGMRRKLEIADKPKVVDYQRGRIEIPQGLKGKREVKGNGRGRLQNQISKSNTEFTVWTDPAVPFGFAAATFQNATRIDDVLRVSRDDEWVIDDFGSGAKSELPDNN